MNIFITIVDSIAFVGFGLALLVILFTSRAVFGMTARLFLALSLFTYVFVSFSNICEHSGISPGLDKYEDYAEMLFMPFFLSFMFALRTYEELRQRNQAEESLRDSESRYRTLTENSAVGIWHLTLDGQTQYINPGMCKLLEVNLPCELEGVTCHKFFSPEGLERMEHEQEKLVHGIPSTFEVELVTATGKRRYAVVSAAALFDEKHQPVGIVATFTDVTSRKAIEKDARESEDYIRTITDSIQAGIIVIDAETHAITDVNVFARNKIGLEKKDIVGKRCHNFICGRAEGQCPITDLKQHVDLKECELVNGVGEELTILKSVMPFMRKGRRYLVESFIDITALKQAQLQQKNIEGQIQQTQKLESLGVLAGGIAHDFNNLLMSIMVNAAMALTETSPENPIRESLQNIEITAKRASELTNQLLTYSGKGVIIIKNVDLNQVIVELGQLFKSAISKKATLVYNFTPELPPVRGDISQIRQVALNLITNASEALGTKDGVITLSTGVMFLDRESLQHTLTDKPLSEGRYVFLEVADTGCGMDADNVKKIFDPFFSTKFAGRGLGLATLLGIVRRHNGAIKVKSEPGMGSTFRVYFPCADISEKASPIDRLKPTLPPEWRGTGTILVVDDEETVLHAVKKSLSKYGYTVLTASNGREAVQVFENNMENISAVLLDLTMPQMNGEETFHVMHQLRPEIPVILTSGYTEQESIGSFAEKGLAGFIQKPYHPDALADKLRKVIEQKHPKT